MSVGKFCNEHLDPDKSAADVRPKTRKKEKQTKSVYLSAIRRGSLWERKTIGYAPKNIAIVAVLARVDRGGAAVREYVPWVLV